MAPRKRHGHAGGPTIANPQGRRSPTYTSWVSMKDRCSNPKDGAYARYGGRGITVCERWRYSFENFLEDMGECPPGLTIERKDNDRGYTPDNCIWATRVAQQANRCNSRKRLDD